MPSTASLSTCRLNVAFLVVLGGLVSSFVVADDQVNTEAFKVETKVFVGNVKQAALETQTLFRGILVYDTILTDKQSVVARFDLAARTVSLLDRQRRIHAALHFDEIEEYHAGACAIAIQRGGLLAFLAGPKFIREFDASDSKIKLSSQWLTYEAIGKQADPNLVSRFVDFADWTKKLSTSLDLGWPAQARVQLNQALKKQNWQVVRVTRRGGPRARWLGVVHSDHAYHYELNEQDENFMQGVEKDLQAFDEVPFFEFRRMRNSVRVAAKN